MRAAVFKGPKQIEISQVPNPELGPGDVIVKVRSAAICGSDIKIYDHGHRAIKPPQILGHEISGEIIRTGKRVQGHVKGERVVVVSPFGCNDCKMCKAGVVCLCPNLRSIGYHLPGGFAEYVRVPEEAVACGNLIPIPDKISFDEACLIEPLSCAVHAQDFLDIQPEDNVAVFGAGPIGLLHLELANSKGAKKTFLINRSRQRLQLASSFGATLQICSGEENYHSVIMDATGGEGVNVAILCAPAKEVQENALSIIAPRGRISFFAGVPSNECEILLDTNRIHYKEISLSGSFGSSPEEYEKAIELIEKEEIDLNKFISGKIALEDIVTGMENVKKAKGLKFIVNP